MEIQNTPFLRLVANQKKIDAESTKEYTLQNPEEAMELKQIVEDVLRVNEGETIYSIANQIAVQGNTKNSCILHDATTTENIKKGYAITISDLSEQQIKDIKRVIYELHHKHSTPGNPSNPVNPDNPVVNPDPDNPVVNPDPDDPVVNPDNPSTPASDDVDAALDKFFEYVHSKNGSITKETGITRTQLVMLTKNDDREEDFGYFFSQLNKIFNVLDSNSNSTLSADEIKVIITNNPELINNMVDIQKGVIASDSEQANSVERAYQAKIEEFAAQIQTQFSAMTLEQKKAFVIARTEEYFNASGMTDQAQALARLKAANKIAYDDLNSGNGDGSRTLGVYLYYLNSSGTSWYSDDDEGDGPGGMFLDINMARDPSTKWYDLVEVMVHEVTHATAYLHPTNLPKWGEHVAYQAGEDYLDSVSEGAWWGFKELDEIREHIATYYSQKDVDLEPNWAWWTYQA